MINQSKTYDNSQWLIPEGRFHGKLSSVIPDQKKPNSYRLTFEVPQQPGIEKKMKAAKSYNLAKQNVLASDLTSWFGKEYLKQRFPSGRISLPDLEALKGERAVLVIGHADYGMPEPFVCINKILPPTRQNLYEPEQPVFELSYASEDSSDDAMAA